MRPVPSLLIVMLAAPLGGCLSWPSLHQPAAQTEVSRVTQADTPRTSSPRRIAAPQPQPAVAQTVPSRRASAPAQTLTDGVPTDVTGATAPVHLSPEWWARENALDEKLRQKMIICRGC
jgi:hypothetical protein